MRSCRAACGASTRSRCAEYRETLDSHGVLDFSETLAQALSLLAQMDEFARSRYRLEGRYHHVLLDEFQDTSRAQWTLVALLIRSWGEGSGVAEGAPLVPSIFLVGDRKQSIYGFRDADVAVMDEAGAFVDGLRADRDSRRAISKSFRAVPQLLAFANDVFADIEKDEERRDAFRFGEQDRFPVELPVPPADALGIVAAPSVADHADAVAAEIRRLLDAQTLVRDPATREPRPITPARHRHPVSNEGQPSGFREGARAPAHPVVRLQRPRLLRGRRNQGRPRAAALSRGARVESARRGVPALAVRPAVRSGAAGARAESRVGVVGAQPSISRRSTARIALCSSARGRASRAGWRSSIACRRPRCSSWCSTKPRTCSRRGVPRVRQARENLKKIRAMIRRVQNRGYATMARLAEHLERLTAGDESNAVIDAGDSVSLMTIHAAKGLEFPVVFVVNLSRGTGGRRHAIRVVSDAEHGQAWLSVGDFQSEADADAKAKDREETKRLLYVALTRARDRLYLASEVKDARWRAFGGSLGDILPAGVKARFEAASLSPAPETTEWAAASGQVHTFRVCAAASSSRQIGHRPSSTIGDSTIDDGRSTIPDNFAPLVDPFELPRVAVTQRLAPAVEKRRRNQIDTSSRSLTGTLVHRLFERFGTSLAARRRSSGDRRRARAADPRRRDGRGRRCRAGVQSGARRVPRVVRAARAARRRSNPATRCSRCRSPFARRRRR